MTEPIAAARGSGHYDLRVPMRQKIRVRLEDRSDDVGGTLLDLSLGGIGVQCLAETTPGASLDFEFSAPASGDAITGRGRVVWIRPARSTLGRKVGMVELGVRFESLSEEDQSAVERIVRSECGLKTELVQADAEVARLRLASKKTEKRSRVQLEAMRQSVNENAVARRKVEDQLRVTGELDLGDAGELFGIGKLSADLRHARKKLSRRESAMQREMEGKKATIAELEEHLSKAQAGHEELDGRVTELDYRLCRSVARERSVALQILVAEELAEATEAEAHDAYRDLENENAELVGRLKGQRVAHEQLDRKVEALEVRLRQSSEAESRAALQIAAAEEMAEAVAAEADDRCLRLELLRGPDSQGALVDP